MDNKNEALVKKITKDTLENKVHWAIADVNDYKHFIIEPILVMRALCTQVQNLKFYIFEQKIYRYDPDTDSKYQDVMFYLIVRKDGITVKELYERTVNQTYLVNLLDAAVDKAVSAEDEIESYMNS